MKNETRIRHPQVTGFAYIATQSPPSPDPPSAPRCDIPCWPTPLRCPVLSAALILRSQPLPSGSCSSGCVSPRSAPCTATKTIASGSRSIACFALCSRCGRPFFIRLIRASGSCRCFHSPRCCRSNSPSIAPALRCALGVNLIVWCEIRMPEPDSLSRSSLYINSGIMKR